MTPKRQRDNRHQVDERQGRAHERKLSNTLARSNQKPNTSKDRSLDFSGLLRSSNSSAGSLDRSLSQKMNPRNDRARSQEKVFRTVSNPDQDQNNSHGQIFDRQKKNRDQSLNNNHRKKPYDQDRRPNRSLSLTRDQTRTLSPASRSFGTLRLVFKFMLRSGLPKMSPSWTLEDLFPPSFSSSFSIGKLTSGVSIKGLGRKQRFLKSWTTGRRWRPGCDLNNLKTKSSETLQGTISKYLSPKNPQQTNTKFRVEQKYKIDDLKNVRSGFISPNHSRKNSRTTERSVNSLH